MKHWYVIHHEGDPDYCLAVMEIKTNCNTKEEAVAAARARIDGENEGRRAYTVKLAVCYASDRIPDPDELDQDIEEPDYDTAEEWCNII